MLTVTPETITATFAPPWDETQYERFIQSKSLPECNLQYDWRSDSYTLTAPARFAHVFGLDNPGPVRGFLPIARHLFDYQQFITLTALRSKRYAVWADTGLGKTAILLEFARQVRHKTGGKVLIISPLNIIQQTLDEAGRFYSGELILNRIHSRSALKQWAVDGESDIGIVNPEKFIPRKKTGDEETVSECHYLAGVVLDEASILKSGGGTIKWALIKSMKGVEYKLTCTATPAPNDTMEYASQGSFLEKLRSEGEIMWTFFCRNKEGEWKIKDHAQGAFYRFMAGWSVYLRRPAAYGFDDNLSGIPAPIINESPVPITAEQRGQIQAQADANGQLDLFAAAGGQKIDMTRRAKYSQIAKGFVYEGKNRRVRRIESNKPSAIRGLVAAHLKAKRQILIWTVFDEEAEIIRETISDLATCKTLSGKTKIADRSGIIEDFRNGRFPVLISKASILGFGLNFQNVEAMIFSGFSDSFEQFYQAIRRAYRYGQTKPVRIDIPYIDELEGVIWRNIQRKQDQFAYDTAIQEQNYKAVMATELTNFLENGDPLLDCR